jgi:hypothetical protein
MTENNPPSVRRRKTAKFCTQEEFDAIRPLLNRISVTRQDIVQAVLVNGASQQELATAHGVSKVAVNKSVSEVYEYILRYRLNNNLSETIPPGWATETITAPRAMLRKFKREVAKAFDELIK